MASILFLDQSPGLFLMFMFSQSGLTTIIFCILKPLNEKTPESRNYQGFKIMVGRVRLELTTNGLKVHCSTN